MNHDTPGSTARCVRLRMGLATTFCMTASSIFTTGPCMFLQPRFFYLAFELLCNYLPLVAGSISDVVECV
ncbi:hypothetical protein I7I50_11850 [Histoplasma capsulatum G186AR]|uniref:Uncharacterized protein n=1 Tax=Ajellomyces capsulatus TaxID=5037 RepID=A0A8H7ZBF7_AJECA|nr:hypothetical protein I7I52_03087 [Histoplasma capsulatum]QSS70276.1 hypothetical protein I7I50_11850 [Histoplasma capsulatum G186AR]